MVMYIIVAILSGTMGFVICALLVASGSAEEHYEMNIAPKVIKSVSDI